MCCCGKPTINGEIGAYSWDGKSHMTYQPNPPALQEGDELVHDEPGRCGGVDCHSHHFRFVKARYGGYSVLVRHGGGDERFGLGSFGKLIAPSLASMDSNARYWLLHSLYSVHSDAERSASERTAERWRKAAAEKRIKTRKLPNRGLVKVWIEPAPTPVA